MDNAQLKGYSARAKSFGVQHTTYDVAVRNDMIFIFAQNPIQIWQDTEVDTVRFDVHIANATDTWWAPLYKVDVPNQQFVLEDYWEMNPTTTGRISITKGTPITLTQGTYFLGQASKDMTAETLGIKGTDAYQPKSFMFNPKSTQPYNSKGQINIIRFALSSGTFSSASDLFSTFPFSSVDTTLNQANFPNIPFALVL